MLVLKGHWYVAAASDDLRRAPLRRAVEGEVLVLFRDSAGRAHALHDRCAHRGMALSRGRVVADCLQCPYHGWKYDGSGRVAEVPALGDGDGLPRSRLLRSYPLAETDGQVWVWIGEGAPGHGPFRFPHYGDPGWASFVMNHRFDAPVEACLENFLDVPHTFFVHPGLFRGRALRPSRARVRRHPDSVEAEFLDETPLEGWGPRLVFPRGTVMRHTDRFILPSISRVDYAFGEEHRFIITSQCTQREEYVTDVTTVVTWRLPLPPWLIGPFVRLYCRGVIRQDLDLLRVVGDQLRRTGNAAVSTSADLLGRHIMGLRRRAAEGAEAIEESVEESFLRI
jgi:nitrite reductase/ring-hydroxylating ferredoxin subunit